MCRLALGAHHFLNFVEAGTDFLHPGGRAEIKISCDDLDEGTARLLTPQCVVHEVDRLG